MFDPKLTKKKKKKKTGFDIDSAIADPSGVSNNDTTENKDKENIDTDNAAPEEEEALDLESFGKKKKKKKKNFNLDDLDAALPETKKEVFYYSFLALNYSF